MKNHKAKFITTGKEALLIFLFTLAVLILFASGSIFFYQIKQLVKAEKWVSHTEEVMQVTNGILFDLVNIEASQRGYLLTDNTRFLGDINFSKKNLTDRLGYLIKLVKDNPQQNNRVNHLNKLINQRLLVLNSILSLSNQKKNVHSERNQTLIYGYELSSQIKSLAHEIIAVEKVLLTERATNAAQKARLINISIVVGGLLGLFLAILIFGFLIKQIKLIQTAHKERDLIYLQLKNIIGNANDMIAALDNNFRFIIFNEPYQKSFEHIFNKKIKIGDSLIELLQNTQSAILDLWTRSLNGDKYVENIEVNIRSEKTIFEITSTPIKTAEQDLIGAVHITRNITRTALIRQKLETANEKLKLGLKNLEIRNQEILKLLEMSDLMLACDSESELTKIISSYGPNLFTHTKGYLFLMHASKNYLEGRGGWGNNLDDNPATFYPHQCWAIRLGKYYEVDKKNLSLLCPHIPSKDGAMSYLCIPMIAQNEIYGVFTLTVYEKEKNLLNENFHILVKTLSEITALAFANIRLRETLRYQSFRDPLTSLYNRRYLEEFMLKQLHQAERSKATFCILMIDLDHFKKINDTYGHDTGDYILKEFAKILLKNIRSGDVVARYGGEEFIVSYFNMSIKNALMRADQIREEVEKHHFIFNNQPIYPVTISIGIVEFPTHARHYDALIEYADKMLYKAKNTGRNRIILPEESAADINS